MSSAVDGGRDWPKGLRALRWLTVLGLAIGTVQLFYFIVIRGELGPPITLQGYYTLAAYPLTVAAVVTGFRWQKRGFVLVLFVACVVHTLVTGYFLVSMLSAWSAELSTLDFFPWGQAARDAPYLAWNLCELGIMLAVLRYLLSDHIRVAR